MRRHCALWLAIATLFLGSLACNAFAGNLPPALLPSSTTVASDSGTATPALALEATSLAESAGSLTTLADLSVRSGPGVTYDRVGFLAQGESAAILGVYPPTGWWKIVCPDSAQGPQCWVSGGQQYTSVDDGQDVPALGAPPAPTPIPPELARHTAVLAYIDDGRLYAAMLDLQQEPPQLQGEARRLSNAANVQTLAIAPDGRRIAYVAGTFAANSLHSVNVDGQDERLLASSDLLVAPGDAEEKAPVINEIQWLPGGEALAFNTATVERGGSAGNSREDLWTVSLDGAPVQRFASGEGGATFLVAQDGRVLFSTADEILRAELDGSSLEQVVSFDPVNLESGSVYYPRPQLSSNWTYVAIPPARADEAGAQTKLWQIRDQGPAVELGAIADVNLPDLVIWSPDANHTAYIQQIAGPDTAAQLVIADRQGGNSAPYTGGETLAIHGWNLLGDRFLYSGQGLLAAGRENAPPLQVVLSSGEQVGDAQWLASEAFIVATGFEAESRWTLRSIDVAGNEATLLAVAGVAPVFAVWHP